MSYIKIEEGLFAEEGSPDPKKIISLTDLKQELEVMKNHNVVIKEQMEWRESLPDDKKALVEFLVIEDELELENFIAELESL